MLLRRMPWVVLLLLSVGCFNRVDNKVYDVTNVSIDSSTYPVVILGGGVAGLTAANYLAQAQIPCIVIEGNKPGGALAQSHSVQNWPGIFDAPGKEITHALKEQVARRGVEVVAGQVFSIDTKQWPYVVEVKNLQTGEWQKIKTFATIIAVGAEPNYLQVPGEKELWGKGVTNCAICDGALYKNKEVVVVGGGDSAVIEALYLSRIARHVRVLVRKDHFRAKDKKKVALLEQTGNVTITFNTHIKEIIGDSTKVEKIIVVNNKLNKEEMVATDGVFLAIGSQPNTVMVRGQLELDGQGYIVLKEGQQASVPGIFAAGDVCDPVYKQAVTSAADGCKSALQAEAFLTSIGFNLTEYLRKAASHVTAAITNPSQAAAMMVSVNTHQELAKLVAQHTNVVLDISTPLCISCQQMEAVINMLIPSYKDKVAFVKADISKEEVDANAIERLVKGSEIASVPTFIFIKEGKEVYRFEGEKTVDEFSQLIQKYF